ncbi:MAG: AAA-like domain-containing protein [Bacteroidales bacterium]|nr:AAA-like domain-containing protein [Bacteroidales bacterium]
MQKRIFNTTGYCNPEWHYIINPLRGLEGEIMNLINNNLYFVIHAPRQTGKTTLLHSLTRKLNNEGKYTALVFSVEQAGYKSISIKEANYLMINAVYNQAMHFLAQDKMPPMIEAYQGSTLYNYMSDWAKQSNLPLVLFIDEIDALIDDTLISVLRQLRDGFQLRPKNFPASIGLIGLRDVRDYKDRVRDNDRSIGSGSPFNIKAKSFSLKNFSKQEIADLYQQYTNETGQVFSNEVIELIYVYTSGQPWLTNALALEITEEILKKDYSLPITPEIARQAKENLILRRDTHLDSLMDKLQDERVKPIIQSIISGSDLVYNEYNDKIQYAIDLGIVKRTKNGIVISNQIYNEIIPRVLNLSFQDSLQGKIEINRFIKPDGKLDMEALLKDFQEFYRENSESWIERFSYKEAGHQLLIMAFLQRVLNGGGNIQREMAIGQGRTDLLVEFAGERFILELKIKNSNYKQEKAFVQLSRYLDKLGQKHGYLILFEIKPSTEISWEDRIKWEKTEFEYLGLTRKITIVEM